MAKKETIKSFVLRVDAEIMEAIEKKELDVVMCYGLNNITINEELLIKFYKYVRSQGMEFLTADHGRDAMKYIDIYIEKNNL